MYILIGLMFIENLLKYIILFFRFIFVHYGLVFAVLQYFVFLFYSVIIGIENQVQNYFYRYFVSMVY